MTIEGTSPMASPRFRQNSLAASPTPTVTRAPDPPKCTCCKTVAKDSGRVAFMCKTCCMQSLRFMARKEQILTKSYKNQELEREAEGLFMNVHKDQMEIEDLEARVSALREKRDRLKKKISEERKEKERIQKHYTERVINLCTKIQAKEPVLAKSADDKAARQAKREETLDGLKHDMALRRQEHCLRLFEMFPICEVRPDMEASTVPSTKDAWAVLQGVLPPSGPEERNPARIYQVRDIICGLEWEKARDDLAEKLKEGALSLPKQLHQQLGSLVLTVELVSNLLQVNDVVIAHGISLRDTWVDPKSASWTSEILDNIWFKLCYSVYALCVAYNLSQTEISFGAPHHNLIQLANYMASGPVPPLVPNLIDVDNELAIRERDHMAEWDTCDDLDSLAEMKIT
ncbi:unnamed protein product, partial [Mesorhabditis spiculigera]